MMTLFIFMKASLIDVSGHEYSIPFEKNSLISEIKDKLAALLNVSASSINIFNPKSKPTFCIDKTVVSTVITPLQNVLFFQITYNEQANDECKFDLPEDLNTLFTKIRRKVTSEEKGKYRSYAEKVKKIPPDFKEKVKTLHDMGYHYDDCEAALRASDYDVERAVNSLLYMNQNNNESDSEFGDIIMELIGNSEINDGNIEQIANFFTRLGQLIHDNN